MPAWAAHDDFKAAAAEGLGHNGVRAGAVEHHTVGNRIFPSWRGKNMAHAAEVAFSLFAHVADENEWQRMPDPHRPQQCRNGQHRGHAGTVVGDPGTIQAASLLADI